MLWEKEREGFFNACSLKPNFNMYE